MSKHTTIIYLTDDIPNFKRSFVVDEELFNDLELLDNMDVLNPFVAPADISEEKVKNLNARRQSIIKSEQMADEKANQIYQLYIEYFFGLLNRGYSYTEMNEVITATIFGFKGSGGYTIDWVQSLEEQSKALNYANINFTSAEKLIQLSIDNPTTFYKAIATNMTPEEKNYIIKTLENKSCMSCTNGSCRVENDEKTGLDENDNPKGYNCTDWENDEYIGKSKVLQSKDIYSLRQVDSR